MKFLANALYQLCDKRHLELKKFNHLLVFKKFGLFLPLIIEKMKYSSLSIIALALIIAIGA